MTSSLDHSALLEELRSAPPSERPEKLRRESPREGDVDRLLLALGDEAEKLAVIEVGRAVVSAELVVALADEIGSPAARARARRALGQAFAYAGRHEDALAQCRDAIDIAESAGEMVQAARARLASLHALGVLGRYDEAIEAGGAAWQQLTNAGEPALAARADLNLGVIHRMCDRPGRAVEHFQRARPHLLNEPAVLAQLESNRGEALLELDDLEAAEDAFKSALHTFEQAGLGWGAAIVEGNLADLATREGRLDRALYHFECARRHLEADQSPTHLARLLVEQGDAKAMLGMLEDAASDYRDALPVLQEHRQPAEAARARAGLARVHLRSGKADEAEECLSEAIVEYESLGKRLATARLNLVRSEAAQSRADWPAARTYASAALEALAEHPIDAAIARFHLAQIALRENRPDDALEIVAPALQTAERFGIAPLEADLLELRARIAAAKDEHEQSVDDFRRAIDRLERVRGALQADRFRAVFLGNRLRVYEGYTAALLRLDNPAATAEAFEAVERAKSRSLLDLVRGVIDVAGTRSSGGDASLLKDLARTQARLNNLYRKLDDVRANDARTMRDAVRKLEDRMSSIEARLSATQGVAELYAPPAGLRDVQDALDDETALIEFAAVEGRLIAFVVARGDIRIHRDLGDVERIFDLVGQFRFQVGRALRPGAMTGNRAERLTRDAWRVLEAIGDTIVQPLLTEIAGATRLVIVPHGVLHLLPFTAVRADGAFLIERFEVVNAPSASLYAHLRSVSPETPSGSPVVVGVADQRAPQIREEARAVAERLPGARTLSGEEATVEAVARSVPHAPIVHFACHGRFEALNPLASGLRLHDRWMTVRDVYRLELDGASVVLSGCETGMSEVASGDELIGILRAFLGAGARAMAVSLWVVEDEAAVEMMRRAYDEMSRNDLKTKNLPKAMRAAQLDLLARSPHPAIWAPFILVGQP